MASQNCILLTKLISQLKDEIAPDLKEDDYFELFANEQILREYDLSYDEIYKGTIGKGGDGGIDGFFIFINDMLIDVDEDPPKLKGNIKIDLFLIQSKNQDKFGEDVVQKFQSSAEDIFALDKDIKDLEKVYNEELLHHIFYFRELYLDNMTKQPELSINYYYASKGDEIHQNVTRKVKNLKKTVKEYFNNAQINFEFVTGEKLLTLSRNKQKESYTLKLKENPISTEDGGYICLANLDDYFSFITDEEKSIQKYLFDANVRDYQGATVVNKDIYYSLVHDRDFEFWWLNNGITILTDKASVSSKVLTISNPQIVNGCQTSFEIYSYFRNNQVKEDKRSLPVRIIVTEDENVRSKVIKSTNSQTSIPPAVLSATDQIHRNIEEYLKHYGLYYDRRKNYWKNEKKPIKDIITISLLAQTFKSMILQEPNVSRAKPSSLVKNTNDYNKIFSTDYNLDGYHRLILLQRKIEKILNETEYLQRGDRLNIRYFVYLDVVLSKRSRKQKSVRNVKKYFEEFMKIDIEKLRTADINDSIKRVYDIYSKLGKTDATAKAKYFTDEVIKNVIE